jgi:hypothetical protein
MKVLGFKEHKNIGQQCIESAADVLDRFGGEVAARRNIARRRAASLSSVENSSE